MLGMGGLVLGWGHAWRSGEEVLEPERAGSPARQPEGVSAGAIEQEFIRKGIAEVWLGWCKRELVDRLKGLSEVRHVQKEASPDSGPQGKEAGEEAPAR